MAMNRLEAFRSLLRLLDREPVIANLGKNCYDLFVAGHRPENLYTWGAMGSVSSLGLGLALARPDLRVVVLDGDGSLLMNLGSLCTIAAEAPKN
ncbi:MAG TPA: thiamine pyrophosphate-dependent enzyme, partial [bacterium]